VETTRTSTSLFGHQYFIFPHVTTSYISGHLLTLLLVFRVLLVFLCSFGFSFFIYFYRCVYGCMFCILLFNSVGYVFLLLRILCSVYSSFHRASWHSPATLTEGFPCFFLSFKANVRVYLAKTGHGPHSS